MTTQPYRANAPRPGLRPLLAVAAALFAGAAAAAAAPSVVDDTGNRVVLDAPAQRIVTLAPHAAEILFAVGAGERIVATVAHTDHPPEARSIPTVGGYDAVDMERILAKDPDLVVAWSSGNGPETIRKLRELGLTVYVSEPRGIESVATSMRRLATLAGVDARATVQAFRERHRHLRATYADRRPVGVFYQIWKQPLMTINGEHLISRVIRLCGGRNVFADLEALVPRISVEAVIQADPEAIVASGMDSERPEWLDDWNRWPSLTAVQRDNLYFVPPSLIQRHGPRILDGAAQLCERLQKAREKQG